MAKETNWKGLTQEQAKALDIDGFLKLIPARRRRSLVRGLTDDQKALMKKLEKNETNIKTHSRNMVIVPQMLGHTIKVYTGKEFIPVIITLEMLGHCLGEFALSRKVVSHSAAGVGSTRSSKAVSAR
jgi:small subunit ribosomal protein S19